jgi:hypothetical protein
MMIMMMMMMFIETAEIEYDKGYYKRSSLKMKIIMMMMIFS